MCAVMIVFLWGVDMDKLSKYAKLTPDIQRALIESRDLAMRNTMAAKIPECGYFGAIAQNLDFIVSEFGLSDEKGN